ncbi:HNH endonuclease signature motif containing protein [Nocardioides sp. Bht2]|uniref:HNH endonuclease signature motif containing protein n=1 Tax=Nocardioides sp. Bht2 TaxID=3392297 RepID=UPI0039B66A5C
MIEIDARHVPYEVTDLDAGCLLAVISENKERALVAARRQLRLAHQWCVLNPVVDGGSAASWCDDPALASLELDDVIGGAGTPAVAAFAAEEFAAASGISRFGALSLLADALDLHHRLPRLWAKVELLDVPGWKARRVAELTRKLSAEAAAWFDQQLATGERYGWPTIERTLAMAVAKFRPDLIRDKTGPLSKTDWDVTLTHKYGPEGTASGTSTLDVVGDSLDLARFHDLVCEEAEKLRRAGDADTLGQRKAKALGSIAETHDTLDFEAADHAGSADAAGRSSRRGRRGLRIFVHTTLADLFALDALIAPEARDAAGTTHSGEDAANDDQLRIADADRLGPILVTQLEDWLKRHGSIASITPVIDLNRTGAVDRHDPPAWMVEQVRQRDPHCVFPHCTRSAADADLDHITAYDKTGPPGQTTPENLAPLCRRHHLTKTHGRWKYQRTRDGNYLWTDHHHNAWLVTALGTIQLD